ASGSLAISLVLCLRGFAVLIASQPACADEPLNGAPKRPFYVIAHNPNTLADVKKALDAGANGLEPDITIGTNLSDVTEIGPDGKTITRQVAVPCSDTDPLANLVCYDSSYPNRGGRCSDTKFKDWLTGVHDMIVAGKAPKLALIVFDI